MSDQISVPVLRNDDETLEERMTSNAYDNILPARYLERNEQGEIVEEQEELFERVGKNIALAELVHMDLEDHEGNEPKWAPHVYGNDVEDPQPITEENARYLDYDEIVPLLKKNGHDEAFEKVNKWAENYQEMMENLNLMPNTPCLINAGSDLQMLSACIAGDSPVYTEDGLKRMDEVDVGDKVLTHKNRFKEVTSHWCNGEKDTIELKRGMPPRSDRSYQTKCTPDHEFLNADGDWTRADELENAETPTLWDAEFEESFSIDYNGCTNKGKSVVVDEGRIKLDNYSDFSKNNFNQRMNQPLAEIENTNELGWLFGMYIAGGDIDGTATRFTQETGSEYIDRIVTIIEDVFGISPTITNSSSGNWTTIVIDSPFVTELFKRQFDTGYDNKTLPRWIGGAPDDYKQSLLNGVLDGVGTDIGSAFRLQLANPTFVYEMTLLARSIGYEVKFKQDDEEKLSQSLTSNYRITKKDKRTVESHDSEDGETVKVYDMEVEDDHSFVVGDFIAHNCFVLEPEDDMNDIHETANEASQVFQMGGGVGYPFSYLRPYGDVVGSTGGVSSGPLEFMKTFDTVCSTVRQGGCVVEDTRVMTEEGYKKISDIHNDTPFKNMGRPHKVNVETHSGSFNPVEKTSSSGSMEVFEIETENGYSVQGSRDHPVMCVRDGEMEYVEIGDITEEDTVVLNQEESLPDVKAVLEDISTSSRHFNENEISVPSVLDNDVAFLLGVLWGDGTYENDSQGRLVFSLGKTEREEGIIGRLKEILEKWDINYSVTDQEGSGKGNYWRIECSSKALVDWLELNGLDKDIEKVPEKLYRSPSSIPHFIGGMVCDAGYNSDSGTVVFSTVSEEFADNIQELLMLCGVPSGIEVNENRENAFGDKEVYNIRTCPGKSTEKFDNFIPHPFQFELSKGGERQNQVPDYEEVVSEVLDENFTKNNKLPEKVDKASMKELRRYERGNRTPSRERLVSELESVQVDVPEVLNEKHWFEPVKSVQSIGKRDVYDIEVMHDSHEFVADNFFVHNIRRGAQMGVMHSWHPDIPFFIHAKNTDVSLAKTLLLDDPDDPTHNSFGDAIEEARELIRDDGKVPKHLRNAAEGHLSNFNISVAVDDEFMDALQNGEEYTMINPRTEEPHIATEDTKELYSWFDMGEYVDVGEPLTIPAEELWDRMVEGAHQNGEPGVIYIDRVNEHNTFDIEEYPEHTINGTNPCVTKGTIVNTPTGPEKVENINEGDAINTVWGVESVDEVKTYTDEDIYRVEFSDGGEMEVTENHRFHVKNKDKSVSDVPLKDIKEGDVVRVHTNSLEKMGNEEDYERWLKRGILLGDGGYTEKTLQSGNVLKISTNEDDKRYNKRLKELFGRNNFNVDGDYSDDKSLNLNISGGRELVEELNLEAQKSINKTFDVTEIENESQAMGILDGLLATDGNVNNRKHFPQIRWFTASYELAHDIRDTLISLGFHGRISVDENEKRGGKINGRQIKENAPKYTVSISGNSLLKYCEKSNLKSLHPSKGEEIQDMMKTKMLTGNTYKATIEDIEYIGKSDTVYDLYCKGSDTWITHGYVQRGCGEEPLEDGDACNLTHINLSTVVDEDRELWGDWFDDEYEGLDVDDLDREEFQLTVRNFIHGSIDWDKLDWRIEVGTRFLDNVVTMSDFPVDKIDRVVQEQRKIGLGIMGLAQLFIELGIEYGTPESEEVARQVMQHIHRTSKDESRKLAEERGVFDKWDESKWANPSKFPDFFEQHTWEAARNWEDGYPQRNHETTTIAPTGTTSQISDTSGGCEPIFSVCYFKNVTDDIQGDEMLVEFDSLFLQTLKENDIDVKQAKKEAEEMMNNNEFDGPESIPSVPEEIGNLFVTTNDLSAEDHASVQCALQEGVGSGISKTVNAPNDASLEDAKDAFEYIYENGGKSVTYYRDGSRTKQVKTTRKDNQDLDEDSEEEEDSSESSESEFKTVEPRERPKKTKGETQKISTPYGKMYVVINEDEYGPVEVFATVGKSGGNMESFTEALARQISLSLRSGVHIDNIIEQLENIRGPQASWDEGETVNSVPDGIALALKRYQEDNEDESMIGVEHQTVVPEENSDEDKVEEYEKSGDICPDCGSTLIFQEGCQKCPDKSCGYSKC